MQNYSHHEVHNLGSLVFAVGTSRFRTPAICNEGFVNILLGRTLTRAILADKDSGVRVFDTKTLADVLP
jgi:hypothetical protein